MAAAREAAAREVIWGAAVATAATEGGEEGAEEGSEDGAAGPTPAPYWETTSDRTQGATNGPAPGPTRQPLEGGMGDRPMRAPPHTVLGEVAAAWGDAQEAVGRPSGRYRIPPADATEGTAAVVVVGEEEEEEEEKEEDQPPPAEEAPPSPLLEELSSSAKIEAEVGSALGYAHPLSPQRPATTGGGVGG